MTGPFDAFSVVTVPFPFTDRTKAKRRPALILSARAEFKGIIGHSVMAMITSAENTAWPLDVKIRDLKQAGLPAPSLVRMKLFTIDHRLVISKIGNLAGRDAEQVQAALQKMFRVE